VLEIDKDNRRLSLGHKQLEDNPWDVFETLFNVGSIHEGKIIDLMDKGAVVSLPYGVEGFATPKHLVKEDGTTAALNETLPFKVIEFNKEAKRIILSHSRVFEDEQKPAKSTEKKSSKTSKKDDSIATSAVEKTTLGDIEELAALKEKMTEEQKPKAPAKPKAKKAAAPAKEETEKPAEEAVKASEEETSESQK